MSIEIPSTPDRVLAVMAHPDDVDFMAGGTMARWAMEGADITYCIVSDGSAGSRDPSMSHDRLVQLRQAEQREAAAAVGAREVIFLGYRDGRVQHTLELRFAIARVIRQVQPDAVVTFDPSVRWSAGHDYINHPDHIATGDATLAAIMPIANTLLAAPELLEEGLEPHDVASVYMGGATHPNVWVPLTEEHLQRKLAALRAHRTQIGSWDYEHMVREWARHNAAAAYEAGLPCEYAEGFTRIVLRAPRQEGQEAVEQGSEEPA